MPTSSKKFVLEPPVMPVISILYQLCSLGFTVSSCSLVLSYIIVIQLFITSFMLKHAAVNLRSIELTGFVSLKNTEGKKNLK